MTTENKMIYVNKSKKSFCCHCGCNVFHNPDENENIFKCNACGELYSSEEEENEKISKMGFEKCEFRPEPNGYCEKCGEKDIQLYFRGPRDAGTYWCEKCIIEEYNKYYQEIFIGNPNWKDEIATLKYDNITLKLPYTYIHHLIGIFRLIDSHFLEYDSNFKKWLENIEYEMIKNNIISRS